MEADIQTSYTWEQNLAKSQRSRCIARLALSLPLAT